MAWKRSDITTEQVLVAFERPVRERYPTDRFLSAQTGAPIKVVWAAMIREERSGLLECGMNLNGGWLTEEGKRVLAEIKGEGNE